MNCGEDTAVNNHFDDPDEGESCLSQADDEPDGIAEGFEHTGEADP